MAWVAILCMWFYFTRVPVLLKLVLRNDFTVQLLSVASRVPSELVN